MALAPHFSDGFVFGQADVVRYLDPDTGEELTRKGRKKGGAYGFVVERIED